MGGMLSPTSARRKSSVKGEMPGIVKRAVSSPDVRDLANLDTSAMTNAEKKRNKLGYHRTAVACVHCRRRKIRCILAMDDPTTRCQNCIRLKKDCQFYPVDQQTAPGKRTRSSSKADESMNESPTPETSPATVGTPWDHSESYYPAHFQPSPVAPDSAGQFSFGNPMLHNENSALSNASYTSLNMYSQSPWNSTPALTSPLHSIETGHFDASHPTHWHPRAQPGPSNHDIAPYPPTAMQSPLHSSTQEHFPQFSASHVGESHGLPNTHYHPVRSMSLATPNDLQNYHSPYHNDPQMFLQRHPTTNSDMQLPSLSSNVNPTPPGSDTHSTPSMFPYGDHPQMSSSYHSGTPMQSPSMAITDSEAFGKPWYNLPTSLADVKEEEEMASMHQHQSMSGRFRQHAG